MRAQFEKNQVRPIKQSEYIMTLEKHVQLPLSGGQPPRINTFAATGDRSFVGTEDDGNIYEITNSSTGHSAKLFLSLGEVLGAGFRA